MRPMGGGGATGCRMKSLNGGRGNTDSTRVPFLRNKIFNSTRGSRMQIFNPWICRGSSAYFLMLLLQCRDYLWRTDDIYTIQTTYVRHTHQTKSSMKRSIPVCNNLIFPYALWLGSRARWCKAELNVEPYRWFNHTISSNFSTPLVVLSAELNVEPYLRASNFRDHLRMRPR